MVKVTNLTIDERGGGPGGTLGAAAHAPDRGETVGQALRSARLARGDDLGTVSRALRIRKDQIEAIEDGRLEALPGRAYAIGFVKSYAKYLGLDGQACAEQFKDETAGLSDGRPQIGPPPPELGPSRMPSGWTVMAILVVGVVLYEGWHLTRTAEVLSTQPVAPVPARLVASGAPGGPRISHAPANQAAPPTTAPAASAKAPSPTSPTAPAASAPAGATALKTASTPASPGAASTPKAAAQTAASGTSADAGPPPSGGQVYGEQNQASRVTIRVRADTHVMIQGPGGKVYINRILHPGDSYRVPDVVGLSLTAQDGGAVSLELDGQDMGAAGQAGQMADSLSLDPQAISDHAHGQSPANGNR